MVREIKESLCVVASDANSVASSPSKVYMMPDGKQAETVQYEWARAAESLFNPTLAGQYSCS